MLKTIKIIKLFGRFNYTLSFHEDGIMIITGPNGYGKSTILKIINNLCNDNIWRIIAFPFKNLEIECDNAKKKKKKNKNSFHINGITLPYNEALERKRGSSFPVFRLGTARIIDPKTGEIISLPDELIRLLDNPKEGSSGIDYFSLFLESINRKGISYESRVKKAINELEEAKKAVWDIRASIGKVHFIQEQRLIEIRENPVDKRTIDAPKVEFVTVINENSKKLKAELAEIMKKHSSLSSYLDSSYIKRLFEADETEINSKDMIKRLRDLQEKQDKLQTYGLAEIQNAYYLNRQDETKMSRFGIELSIYLEDANKKYELFEPIINKLDLYKRIVNQKLSFKEMFLSSSDGIVVKTNDGVILSLDELSSGEQEILVLFYKLIFESDANLLLIDEPEISLHIAWQKELMGDLKEIVKLNKNIRVIIATHSPQIISHNWQYQIDLGGMQNG